MFHDVQIETWLVAFSALCNMLTPALWLAIKLDIGRLERNTNSKFDAFLKVKGEAEHAKGVIEGKQEA